MARLRQPRAGVLLQVRVRRVLVQGLAHALKHAGVDVSRALAEVGRHAPLYLRDVEQVALVVDLLHDPHVPGNGDLLARGRRRHEGADLLRLAAHGVLDVLLEDGVELVVVGHALAGEAHDEAASLRLLDVILREHITQKLAEVVDAHAVEVREREHARGELRGRKLAFAGKNRQRLVAKQAVRQAVQARRLDPVLLSVELHEGDALQQLPRDGLWREGAGLGLVLAHDEPHLGRLVAPARAAHALEEPRHGKGRVDLERAVKAPDVDAELERGRGDDGEVVGLVAHELFCGLADGRGEVSVVDEEPVGLAVPLAVGAQHGADVLGLLARVCEHEALLAARVLEDIADAGVGVLRRRIGFGLGRGPRVYLHAQFRMSRRRLNVAFVRVRTV